ncbi:hypothetical protein ASE37_22915 [Rhizobium sp. Root268]|nr:hypothetical protein ASC86_21870 [Rhizobium sp. Root1212]KRD31609.1 hypothetical protein ASE37_22915 [Rhizobium sp. Root268]
MLLKPQYRLIAPFDPASCRPQTLKPGFRTLINWTDKNARKFATTGINDIIALLQEIELLYDDVDQIIVGGCEEADNLNKYLARHACHTERCQLHALPTVPIKVRKV